MQLYTREETIRKINHLGQSCRPFIFIINYLQDASYIEEVASVDPSEVCLLYTSDAADEL